MIKKTLHTTPADGFKGLIENWRNDFIAAISVSLVAMPLALGIAVASGAPPMSGILSAIIGGVVTTFFRGSHLAINGPAAGLIAVILASLVSLEDGSGRTLNYVLAAIVLSGAIQVVLGFLKLGRFAEIFPSSVIRGIMAAIGVIIFTSQMHVAMGTSSDSSNTIGAFLQIFENIPNINPFVAIISLVGILLLFFHSKISYKLFHFLPAPIWVLALAIPFVYAFNFFEPHTIQLLGKEYQVGPELLISIPDNPLDAILFPDFSKISTLPFWLSVISINLIASIQTLAMAKAVDKLDPYRRKTDLNKDLIGVGLSTMVAGAMGGLPIITVIVRSTVNVHNNAKTRWSNFHHGLLLIIFIVLLAPVIQKVPLAALAAILVFTGYKLAAPRVFAQTYEQGVEQVLFMVGTMIITLYTDLLWGIIGGMILTLSVHFLLSRVPVSDFFRMIFKPATEISLNPDGSYHLKIRGIINFLSMVWINKVLNEIPLGSDTQIDLSDSRMIDLTVLENLENFKDSHENKGGAVIISGVEHHVASTTHRLALKSLHAPLPQKLAPRQEKFRELAVKHGWTYRHEVDLDTSYLRNFQFFETRPIEYKNNVINGVYPQHNIRWEISDITFDEGAFLATEVYNTTVQLLNLPFEIPKFIIEKEGIFDKVFDRVMAFSGQKDIDLELFPYFSEKFLLKGEDEIAIQEFFTPNLIQFLEHEDIYHVESNGEALLIFKYLRLAREEEVDKMLHFSEQLVEKIIL